MHSKLAVSVDPCPLPGEDGVDEDLLDGLIPQINTLYVQRGLQMAEALGKVLLGRFFDGDLDAYRARGGYHQSLHALALRGDLRVPYDQLLRYLAVLDQLQALPLQLGQALSIHHHEALLAVRDPVAKQGLAERAILEDLSVHELLADIEAILCDLGRGGPTVEEPR